MTYSITKLTELIYNNHTEFAGRAAEYGDILRILQQTRDFLKTERAAISADFNARVYIAGSYNTLPSVITIGLAEDGDGLTYREQRA